jgi:hypothetical protein
MIMKLYGSTFFYKKIFENVVIITIQKVFLLENILKWCFLFLKKKIYIITSKQFKNKK